MAFEILTINRDGKTVFCIKSYSLVYIPRKHLDTIEFKSKSAVLAYIKKSYFI